TGVQTCALPISAPNGAGLRDAVRRSSLDGDGGAGGLELLLGLVGLLLGDTLEDGLGGAVDEVLGLLEAERRERTHLLDDLDLLVADGLEDDVELRLLLGRLLGGAGRTRGGGHDGSGRSGRSEERRVG